MKETSLLLKFTGESPLLRIVDFLIENKGADFTKKQIIEGAELSRASLFNYWGELEKYHIVKVTRTFGKTKLYVLNSENQVTKKLLELESTLIRQALLNTLKKEEPLVA